jgi:GNAT superfamily N-acetyltransferase
VTGARPTVGELLAAFPQRQLIREEHLAEVSEAFVTLLPDYFLNRLGAPFLARTYWKVFCGDPENFGFVWVVDDHVVGFMTGTFARERFLGKVIMAAPLAFVWRCMLTAVTQPAFLKQAFGLLLVLRHERSRPGPSAELMSLGVLPRALRPVTSPAGKATSPARVLLGAALAAMRERGIPDFRLYAGTSNHLACAMYRKLGFVEANRFTLFGEEKLCFVGTPATDV